MARVVKMFVVCVALAALAAAQSCPKVSYGSPQTFYTLATPNINFFAASASKSTSYLAIYKRPVNSRGSGDFFIFKLVNDQWTSLQTITMEDMLGGGLVGISGRYLVLEARVGKPPPKGYGSTLQLHYRANDTFNFVLRTQIDTLPPYGMHAFSVANNVLAVLRAVGDNSGRGVDVYRLSPTSISKTQSITTSATRDQNVVVTRLYLFITLQNSAVSVYRRSSESIHFQGVQTLKYASLPSNVRGGTSTSSFGSSMDAAYSGATLAVGCPYCSPSGKPLGVVYVYALVNDAYAFRTALISNEGPSSSNTEFAQYVSASGGQVSVGAASAESGGLMGAGAVYTFTKCSSGGFSQSGVLRGAHDQRGVGLHLITRGNQLITTTLNDTSEEYPTISWPLHIGKS